MGKINSWEIWKSKDFFVRWLPYFTILTNEREKLNSIYFLIPQTLWLYGLLCSDYLPTLNVPLNSGLFLWLMNTTQPRPPKILSLFIIWEFVSTFHAQRLQLTQRRLFERWEFMVTGHWIRAAPTYEAMNGQQYSVSSRVLVAQSAREYNCVCINVGQYDCIRICNNGVDNNCFCVCIDGEHHLSAGVYLVLSTNPIFAFLAYVNFPRVYTASCNSLIIVVWLCSNSEMGAKPL